jgi:hypothetical protein
MGGYNSSYDAFTSINYITGILYDASGKEMKRSKKRIWMTTAIWTT